MRIVLDTNVVVSGLRSPSRAPAEVLGRVKAGAVTVLYDARILAEYREVLARPKFKGAITPESAAAFVAQVEKQGECVDPAGVVLAFALPDPGDAPFAEVAIAGKADALVTGNARHFPKGLGVPVLTPREMIDRLRLEPARQP